MKHTRSFILTCCACIAATFTACSGGSDDAGFSTQGDYGVSATDFANGKYKLSFEGGALSLTVIPNIGTSALAPGATIASGVQGSISYGDGKQRTATFNYETTADEGGSVLSAVLTVSNIQAYEANVDDDVEINGGQVYNTTELADKVTLLKAFGYTPRTGNSANNTYDTAYWELVSAISMPNTIKIEIVYRGKPDAYALNLTPATDTDLDTSIIQSTVTIYENIPVEDNNQGNGDAAGDAGDAGEAGDGNGN